MVRKLAKYEDYSRKEVHDIFDPTSPFTPQRGVWGFQGIVPLSECENDFVFFVTFGRVEAHHTFEEGVTTDGVLSWQSQPKQKLETNRIKTLIKHDHNINNIYLFLRTNKKVDYTYLGKLGYISHDNEREQPVYFKWQIMDWELTDEQAKRIKLELEPIEHTEIKQNVLVVSDPPLQTNKILGSNTTQFHGRHVNFDSNNRLNKQLGKSGELLVLQHEKEFLIRNGRHDLANLVDHTAEKEGDGTGYDIRSYNLDGEIKYIEVKTTRASKQTPFYLTIRELVFSKQHPEAYFLYRVFDFDETSNTGGMYQLNGDLEQQVKLQALTFKATTI
ncbi:DUF3427 domain-containing protein [Lysinibacillus fusiformis]|uniref:DUF3427 domain-containing protein n=1 Tax=Lysinibacillus fusiformis TaxID=28031 RepID=UPI00187FB39B|nr:DUF3883 domain-containing protein [Lysinibacillus fusiformis]MBD8522361.1 DUF3427 domain-containing protein [Lysinibacillus fusiformis]